MEPTTMQQILYVAALAVFVCSPEAGKLTGQAISVNGGISAA